MPHVSNLIVAYFGGINSITAIRSTQCLATKHGRVVHFLATERIVLSLYGYPCFFRAGYRGLAVLFHTKPFSWAQWSRPISSFAFTDTDKFDTNLILIVYRLLAISICFTSCLFFKLIESADGGLRRRACSMHAAHHLWKQEFKKKDSVINSILYTTFPQHMYVVRAQVHDTRIKWNEERYRDWIKLVRWVN